MLLSTTTFLSLLAVIPFALASPTRVQERDPTRVQEREKPDPAIYTDEPSMQFFADTKDRCSSSDFVKIDLENPGCQAFNGKVGSFFRTDLKYSPVPKGLEIKLYDNVNCGGEGTKLGLFETGPLSCNRARNTPGKEMTVQSVKVTGDPLVKPS